MTASADLKGKHKYADDGTSDCAHGCGCWMGPFRSGGPDGIDPFGKCPKAPPITSTRTTTAALIAEAKRLDAEATWIAGNASNIPWPMLARIRSIVPQLADALVAAEGMRHESEARLAKVRERDIHAVHAGDDSSTPQVGWLCSRCSGYWDVGQPETHHAPDCPARPMEDA